MPTDIAKLVAAETEQDHLMESARSAIARMSKARRRQLFAELFRRIEADEGSPAPPQAPKTNGATAAAPPRPASAPSPKANTAARVVMTNRRAITLVMRGNAPMSTGFIAEAVAKIKPDSNYPSVASELARMRKETPPLVVSKGKTSPGNNDLWALTTQPVVQASGDS